MNTKFLGIDVSYPKLLCKRERLAIVRNRKNAKKIKSAPFIRLYERNCRNYWVILYFPETKRYSAFSGMWYGTNPLNIDSHGKEFDVKYVYGRRVGKVTKRTPKWVIRKLK